MFIGIDLGTTNSAVAALGTSGRPEMLANADGTNVTPSAVYFEPGETERALVGHLARAQRDIDPARLFESFKRRMADPAPITQGGLAKTPVELSTCVLRRLVEDASARVGPIRRAVVTVPANFANEARLATLRAADLAGLLGTQLINEPTAALFYYSFDRAVHGTVVVYDFGGGTLDVTVARVDGKNVEIVTSRGDPRLGGIDFDRRLQDLVMPADFDPGVHQLSTPIEELKKQLSFRDEATVHLAGGAGGRRSVQVTRAQFESACASLIAKSSLLVESVLAEAGLKPAEVTDVFLVGGSTRMPMVQRHLEKLFGRPPVCHVNPDEVVALGAALYAGYSAGRSTEAATTLNPEQASAVGAMSLLEVANHYFGSIALEQQGNLPPRLRNSILIKKNSALPCSHTESYYTVGYNQRTVECRVTQSSTPEMDPDFVRVIWSGKLGPLPAGRPPGMEVSVTYSYDRNQLMHCTFVDVASGVRQDVRLGLGGDAAETGDRFVVE
jgi:molecular chaperone DnaK